MASNNMESGQTQAEKNREIWDEVSSRLYKEQWVLDMHEQITKHVAANMAWLGLPDATGRKTKMLDYACGNGFMTAALYRTFDRVVGVDLSDGMLAGFRERMAGLGVSESRVVGVRGDLITDAQAPTEPALAEGELDGFDLAVIVLSLHHIDDYMNALRSLGERLRPGGVLFVIDIVEGLEFDHRHRHHHHEEDKNAAQPSSELKNNESDDDAIQAAAETSTCTGFSEEVMRQLFEPDRWADVSYVMADEMTVMPPTKHGKVRLFYARGAKKA